jgi:hypothetical protein
MFHALLLAVMAIRKTRAAAGLATAAGGQTNTTGRVFYAFHKQKSIIQTY